MHHPLVKVGHDHLPDAVAPAHQLRPIQGGAEQGHRRGFQNQVLRVGVKGHRRRHGPQLQGLLPHPAQQGPVAQVHAVEEAQGNDSFFSLHCAYTSKKLLMVVAVPASHRPSSRNSPPGP